MMMIPGYMMREATALFVLWYKSNLRYCVFSLASYPLGFSPAEKSSLRSPAEASQGQFLQLPTAGRGQEGGCTHCLTEQG
jgi:hypothetical protein